MPRHKLPIEALDTGTPVQPAKGQLAIDFDRSTRMTCVERLIIPPFVRIAKDGTRSEVLPGRASMLLIVLERLARDGGPCFVKLETLAKRMKSKVSPDGTVNTRTATRAIKDAEELGLIKVERSFYKHAASRYEIVWEKVKELILAHPDTASLIDMGERAREQGRIKKSTEATPDKREVTPDRVSFTHDNLSFTHDRVSVTHDRLSRENGGHTSTRTRAVLNHELNHERKPEIKPCSTSAELSTVVDVEELPSETPSEPDRPTGGWGRQLGLNDFLNRDVVQALFEHAVKFKFVDRSDRVRFFTLAKYVGRMSRTAGGVQKPGAYFTAQLRARNWLGDHSDTKAAINAISIIDGGRK